MDHALATVRQLVADFAANEKAYLSPTYSESQVRQDFIDKFFTALGWDVNHSVQRNPYEQEVKIENRVTMADSQRRADYAFSIAPNFEQVKFFVEAKKPSRSLANADDYFQTIRYAWNTRIPIAVLTDFEEFHILDCRHKPNIKTALNNKIAEFRYTDYQNEEEFAKIFHLFGRDAVANGSLEKYAAALPKKGKKTPGTMQLVDDAFLEELDSFREILAKAFKKTNEQLGGDELTEAVQRTIDRLVFIRFLEDKGIEDKQIVTINDPKNAWKSFTALCKRLEPKYNGLVFKPHRILDSGEFTAPDGAAFAGICQKISDPSSPYDFNQIPISILGSIYERFLGKVVHATDKRVKVEEKPEVRKAGGVYYTPEYIVKYIVKETVGTLIDGKTPEQIAGMAFADIACGSGSFLIEVYAQVLNYHLQYYTEHPEKAGTETLFERNGVKYLTLKKKKEILLNNVYGVDIDFQATEVTQLSLYLKMLENATMNEAHQFGLFKETILPDLRQNIISGNSLIGTDIVGLFNSEELDKLKSMNYEDIFPQIHKRGGFDAIVGNPPYGVIFSNIEKQYLKQNYKSMVGKYDSYGFFIEKAVNLLKDEMPVGYIIPHTWLTVTEASSLRKFLLDSSILNEIVKLPSRVFDKATVETIIVILKKQKDEEQRKSNAIRILLFGSDDHLEEVNPAHGLQRSISQNKWDKAASNSFNIDVSEVDEAILSKVWLHAYKMENYCDFSVGVQAYDSYAGQSKSVIKNRVYHSTTQKDSTYFKELGGSDIYRYYSKWSDGNWISYGKWLAHPRNEKYFEGERILVREIVGNGKHGIYASFLEEKYINYKTVLNIKMKEDQSNNHISIKYILGLLNSSLMTYCFRKSSNKIVTGTFPRISLLDMKQFPIFHPFTSNGSLIPKHDVIVGFVDQMLDLKAKMILTKTESELNRLELLCESVDRKLDNAVNELYSLTEEEIRIVEGKV